MDSPYSANREYGSKASQFFHHYILTPFQSLQVYLSSSTRDREASASTYHPAVRKLPPWLLPHYRGRKLVIRSTVLRPLCRLLLLVVILAVLIVSTLFYSFRESQPELADYDSLTEFNWTPINPRSYLSPMNASFGEDYDVLLDGHSHSIYSDGRMSPETLLKWHIANGFNAVIVSDHNTINGGLAALEVAESEEYAGKITVIPAMELSTCRLHMNLIGINETIDVAIKKWPTDDELRQTIARTHELGGLAIINHIPWSNTTEYGYELPRMQNHPSREQLVEMGIDGFEIANSGTLDTISLKFIQDHNLLLITGTDVHYPDSNAFSWTILNTNGNRTIDNIMTQLKARRTSFLFDPTGTQPLAYPPENPLYYKTAPPTLLGQYFQMFWIDQTGMYSFSPTGGFCHQEYITIQWKLIGYFVAWVLVGFLLFEAARLLIVGCCWGPFLRRRRYLRKKKWLEEEEGLVAGSGGLNGDNGERRRSSVGAGRHELEEQPQRV
ncbi:hypothetical protein BGZ47_004244 [Haplosporangium gracile]|nr:hypothetical protein BGZ47_004244 [Haplosporangium gracile]